MNKFFLKIFTIALSPFLIGNTNALKAQNVFIPDTAFLVPLLNNPAININADGFIQVSEANAYTGEINVEWNSITDLTGIEAFISITVLNCSNNQISNLNLATNTALTQVVCANNQINNLNVNTILSLSYLNCSNNQLSNIDVSANTALSYLNCSYNGLNILDVSANTALSYLNCSYDGLSVLDVSSNIVLTELKCRYNGLSSIDLTSNLALLKLDFYSNVLNNLDLSNNLSLTHLTCGGNALTSLDLSANTVLDSLTCESNGLLSINLSSNLYLEFLDCNYNMLTFLDVSTNTALTRLVCSDNQLSTIDLSNNIFLTSLVCSYNQLNYLDLSTNVSIAVLQCTGNQLSNLNLQNGFNNLLTSFFATQNPLLTCVQVDNIGYMNTTWPNAIDASASYNTACAACVVTIPDNAFKNALVNNPLVNTNTNTEIECSEAAAYTGFLMLAAENIFDLTGLEAFVNLTGLNVSANLFNTLDVSSNVALVDLRCAYNDLTSLDISNCPSLKKLWIWNNQITSLNFADNPHLDSVDFSYNNITNVDLSANTELLSLNCGYNQITDLDLSSNMLLEEIYCYNNNLTSLNIQNGNNSNLIYFAANNNANGLCVKVDDVGTMLNDWPNAIDVGSNYSVTCGPCTVFIPDANFKSALVNNPTINTNGNSEIECSEAIAYTSFINVSNSNISDLTGIEAFTGITMLNCSVNQLTDLDLSTNTALTNLNCTGNNISNLNISNCLNLVQLFCSVNQITSLDLSNHFYLEQILCNENALTSLNIQNGFNDILTNFLATTNPNLTCIAVDNVNDMITNWPSAIDGVTAYNLNCNVCTINVPDANFKAALLANPYINTNSNQEVECTEAASFTGSIFVLNSNIADLTGIEAFTGVTQLNCSMNQLTSLDLSANAALYFVEAHSNQLTNLILPSGSTLSEVIVSDNQLTSIDLSSNSYLSYLDCNNNNLTSLNVLSNSYVSYIFCSGNQITDLDCSNNASLIQLGCANNDLINLNIQNGNNSNLTSFDASNNPQLTCIQVDSVAAMNTNWPGAIDATASYNLACSACVVNIPDVNFKNALLANTILNSNSNSEIECTEADSYSGNIDVENLGITDLTGIEAFTSLTQLECNINQITTLDLSNNYSLQYVKANSNLLTSITLPAGSNLSEVVVAYNQLSSIDVGSNSYLTYLDCEENNISNLNLMSNTYLSYLFCDQNQLSNLDCSNNYNLIQLNCDYNQLTNLNLQNGNNANLTSFEATNNPNLNCVQVDSVAYMVANWPISIDITASYSLSCAACTVTIPDVNFKNALLSNSLINTNGDNDIQCAEAVNFNGIIQVIGLGITDLTGIEAFVNIVELNCAQNALTGNLDLSSNTLLTDLDCSENQLTGLNVSACTMLYELVCAQNQIIGTIDVSSLTNLYNFRCEYNQLTSIDISNNTNLYSFGCGSNQLNSLDVSSNTALVHLEFENNQIANINISNNNLLVTLSCSHNLLSNIDVSNNPNLEVFYCDFNQLSNLNITNNNLLEFFNCSDNMLSSINVSNNTALYMFYCSYNQINGYLDLSNHTALGILNCSGNQLIGLNIQNGNNMFLSFFDATQNPGLTCVQVDSVQLMNTNWSSAIDANASYSLLCGPCIVNIPDANFKNELLSNLAINTNSDNEIQCAEAVAFTGYLNVQLSNIADLTGIEAFVNIDSLNCLSNQLTNLDLTSNTSLIFLQCYGNQLSNLNLTGLTDLKVLYCYQNNLTSLDVSTNTALILLNCNANQITSLNTSSNTALLSLGCGSNQISNLNIASNTLLTTFGCNNNSISSLNLQFNPLISTLTCDDNQISFLDLSGLTQLDDFGASNNQLTYLNVQNGNNVNLQDFDATGNPNLTCVQVDDVTYMNNNFGSSIDATAAYNLSCACIVNIPDLNFKNALLANLNINTNGNLDIECSEATSFTDTIYVDSLAIADLTGIEAFTAITGLVCNNNLLTTLDLTSNTVLQFLHVYDNQLTSLNVTNNAALVNLWCSFNNLNTIDVSNNLLLEGFACFYNNFTNIDVTNNLVLKDLRCAYNNITTVDLSNNAQLELLYAGNCIINTLDLSNNLLLQELDCGPNLLSSLDLSNNQSLFLLEAGQNDLVNLDVSNNPSLTTIFVNGNALTTLKINNGNNDNLNNFSAVNNPNLTCIQVDDANYMNTNWSNAKDAIASYSLNCSSTCPAIPIAFSASSTNITSAPMSVSFTNSTPNLTNYDFIWYFGDGTMLASNASSVNHTYYYNGIYSVSLVAFDNTNGCYDTLYNGNYITCNASGAFNCNHTVALNPSGLVNACAGSMVPLNGTTSISLANFQWNRNGVMIGGASQDNYLANANGNYTLTVFDVQGCPITSSPTQINYSLQSSVAPIITATGPVSNCGNVNVTLTAIGSFSNYLWSTGQTGSSITVTQGGSYTVIGQSPACDAISIPTLINGSYAPLPPICMVTVDETNNKNIVIWEKPVSNEIDSFLILREDIDLAGVYAIIGSQSYTDLSEFNDVNSDANARAYRYKLAVKDTCGGITIASAEQRSIHLDVAQGNSVLARQLTWNVYQGQPQAFAHYLIYRETAPGNLNLALIDSVPSTQTWYYDNTLTQLSDTARAYKIGYRITTPCVSTRAQNEICSSNVTSNERPVVGGPDGINQLFSDAFDFTIYPNPNDGKFMLQYQSAKNYQLKVYNLIGEKLFQTQINNHQTTIDLNDLSNGIYLLSLYDGKQFVTKRLVIAK